jgi:hypothetical protein
MCTAVAPGWDDCFAPYRMYEVVQNRNRYQLALRIRSDKEDSYPPYSQMFMLFVTIDGTIEARQTGVRVAQFTRAEQ